MPQDKPRYLMGVGTPGNIIEAVYRGVDFFDCVMPARNGRHGHLYTWEGVINIKNEKYARDERPIDPECHCPVCRKYSRAYLRHLMKAEEILALRFCVMHNLYFYNSLMEKIRAALDEGQYQAFLPHCLRLLPVGGLLIVDDVLQGGTIAQTRFSVPRRQRTIHKRLRNFLWEITHHDALETSIIPIGDGVALCYKKKEIIPETKTEGETKNAE